MKKITLTFASLLVLACSGKKTENKIPSAHETTVTSSLDDAALLVVGTEQARGLDRLMLGSVSHALILAIRVPTIVVAPECLI